MVVGGLYGVRMVVYHGLHPLTFNTPTQSVTQSITQSIIQEKHMQIANSRVGALHSTPVLQVHSPKDDLHDVQISLHALQQQLANVVVAVRVRIWGEVGRLCVLYM